MWILILTITLSHLDGVGGGVAMQEFSTKQACIFAGDLWLKGRLKGRHRLIPEALCVPK